MFIFPGMSVRFLCQEVVGVRVDWVAPDNGLVWGRWGASKLRPSPGSRGRGLCWGIRESPAGLVFSWSGDRESRAQRGGSRTALWKVWAWSCSAPRQIPEHSCLVVLTWEGASCRPFPGLWERFYPWTRAFCWVQGNKLSVWFQHWLILKVLKVSDPWGGPQSILQSMKRDSASGVIRGMQTTMTYCFTQTRRAIK